MEPGFMFSSLTVFGMHSLCCLWFHNSLTLSDYSVVTLTLLSSTLKALRCISFDSCVNEWLWVGEYHKSFVLTVRSVAASLVGSGSLDLVTDSLKQSWCVTRSPIDLIHVTAQHLVLLVNKKEHLCISSSLKWSAMSKKSIVTYLQIISCLWSPKTLKRKVTHTNGTHEEEIIGFFTC